MMVYHHDVHSFTGKNFSKPESINMESDSEHQTILEAQKWLYKDIYEVQKIVYHKQLEENIYPLRDRIESLEEEVSCYCQREAEKDDQINKLTAEKKELLEDLELFKICADGHDCVTSVTKATPKKGESDILIKLRLQLSKTERQHETEMFNIQEELKNEKANCQKQQEAYEKQLDAVRSAAAQQKAELQLSHEQELETVRSETHAAKLEHENYDKTIDNLNKKIESILGQHKKDVHKLKKEYEDSGPEIARLCVKIMTLNETISQQSNMIQSLQNNLQEKEDIIKKEAAQFSKFKEMSKPWKEGADREQETRDLLASEVQENNERKATIENLEAELETKKAKIEQLQDTNKEYISHMFDLECDLKSLFKTLKHQIFKCRKLEERICLPKQEAQHYKEELFNCTQAFENAFPHRAHNQDPAFREFLTRIQNIKEKYFQGATVNTIRPIEKVGYEKAIECFEQTLEKCEKKIERLLKEVEKQKRKNAEDCIKYMISLTEARTSISEWGNSLLKEEQKHKEENYGLRTQLTELRIELKKEERKKMQPQGETPRTSAPQPKTAVPKAGPSTVKRGVPPCTLTPSTRALSLAQPKTAVSKAGPSTVKRGAPTL